MTGPARQDGKHCGRRRVLRRGALAAALLAVLRCVLAVTPAAAQEKPKPPAPAPPPDLNAVISGFHAWLLTFATGLTVLALTVAGLFYLFAGGNPTQIERAKLVVRAAIIGYSLMVLAPLLLAALRGIVG